MKRAFFSSLLGAAFLFAMDRAASAEADVVLADFEGESYGDWKVEGTAFGTSPARGTLPNQMHDARRRKEAEP